MLSFVRKIPMKTLMFCIFFMLIPYTYANSQKAHPVSPAFANGKKIVLGLIKGVSKEENTAFNLMLEGGAFLVHSLYDVPFIEATLPSPEASDQAIEDIIAQGANLIIAGGGFRISNTMDIVAQKHPDIHFVLLDDFAKKYRSNVSSITFRQNEASYLAGAVAAWRSRSNKIGLIGAMDVPVINDFVVGYKAGAYKIRPDISVDVRYIATQFTNVIPFAAPQEAQTMADDMYDSGCDVIFGVAATSNLGIFQSARNHMKFAIGVDSNQDAYAPGLILTSVMKRLDMAILHIVDSARNGRLENINISMGLKENAVSITSLTYTEPLFSDLELRQLKMFVLKIIQGVIHIPSTINTDPTQHARGDDGATQ